MVGTGLAMHGAGAGSWVLGNMKKEICSLAKISLEGNSKFSGLAEIPPVSLCPVQVLQALIHDGLLGSCC